MTEVPWSTCAEFVDFMWNPTAHKFDLLYFTWLVQRGLRVCVGGTHRHEYQAVDP